MAEPQVRASMSKDFLVVLDEHFTELAKRVRAALSEEGRECIERASRVDWIHLRHHTELNQAALSILGTVRYQQAWRRAMLRSVEQKTLRATVTGALRLFGATPAALMKLAPRAWNLLARDAGTLEAEIDPDAKRGRMTLTEFPEAYFADGSFAEGLVGCLEAFLDICETQGEVVLSDPILAAGRAVYELSWQ